MREIIVGTALTFGVAMASVAGLMAGVVVGYHLGKWLRQVGEEGFRLLGPKAQMPTTVYALGDGRLGAVLYTGHWTKKTVTMTEWIQIPTEGDGRIFCVVVRRDEKKPMDAVPPRVQATLKTAKAAFADMKETVAQLSPLVASLPVAQAKAA